MKKRFEIEQWETHNGPLFKVIRITRTGWFRSDRRQIAQCWCREAAEEVVRDFAELPRLEAVRRFKGDGSEDWSRDCWL